MRKRDVPFVGLAQRFGIIGHIKRENQAFHDEAVDGAMGMNT